MSPLLAELGRLATESGAIAQGVRGDMTRELKRDGSIVTDADRAVETFLRDELPRLIPGTTVWGEEFGRDEPGPGGRWAVDPVDGTSNFSFGSPLWGVCIALQQGNAITAAAGFLPDLGELYLVERGGGAFCNGEPMAPIPPGPVLAHELVTVNESIVKRFGERRWPGKMRASGAAIVDGVFTARQRFRALVGYNEHLYDVGPTLLLGQELGAEVRYADGGAIELDTFGLGAAARPWVVVPRESGVVFDLG